MQEQQQEHNHGGWWIICCYNLNSNLNTSDLHDLHNTRSTTQHAIASYHQIDLDLLRTCPNHAFFSKPSGLGQVELRNVLYAYVRWEEEAFNTNTMSGYVQGMNLVAGHLLQHVNAFHAFYLFSHIMVHPKFCLQEIVRKGMPGLYRHLNILEKLMEQHLPSVATSLHHANVPLLFFATEWILTLFSYRFDGYFLNRFFDLFFEHGWPAFYSIFLSLLDSIEETLVKIIQTSNEDDWQAEVLFLVKNIGSKCGAEDKMLSEQRTEQIFQRATEFQIV